MRRKITIITVSLLSAFIIMSSGYGLWQKDLAIEGDIRVVPNPDVINSLEDEIDQKYKEIDSLLEAQRIAAEEEEERLVEEERLAEEQRTEEELKFQEELKALEAQKVIDDKDNMKQDQNVEPDKNFEPEKDVESRNDSEDMDESIDDAVEQDVNNEVLELEAPLVEGEITSTEGKGDYNNQ